MIFIYLIFFAFCQAQITQLSCGNDCTYFFDSLTMIINVNGIIDSRTQWDINKLKTINTLKMNGNIKEIPENFIEKFTSLKTVELHIENVLQGMFSNTQIENVIIGKEVKQIEERVFEHCDKLTSIQFVSLLFQ